MDSYQNKKKAGIFWSIKMADSVMVRNPDLTYKWSYDYGVVFKGFEQVWLKTKYEKYFHYIKRNMDGFVREDGNINGYTNEYNIDHINNGKVLLFLYEQTGEEKYKKAAFLLRQQLKTHPRTSEGGFWHKKIYPHQMWLDGLYMGAPFYAEFAKKFNEHKSFDDVAKQLILMEKHAKDPKTGLLYHAWDESKEQAWANKETGQSPNFWGRAMGWYSMALVDVLDHLPKDHKDRKTIIKILQNLVSAVVKVQDMTTGVWYQVLDQGGRSGNYHEASASCMFTYTMAKAIRFGYIDIRYIHNVQLAYEGIIKEFIEVGDDGLVNLKQTCAVAGLGGNPYRDGTYNYYISEPIQLNDLKGIGAFLLASSEVERLNLLSL